MTDKIQYDRVKTESESFKLVEFGAQQYFLDFSDVLRQGIINCLSELIGYKRASEFNHEYPIGFFARNIGCLKENLDHDDFIGGNEELNVFLTLIQDHYDLLDRLIQDRLKENVAEFDDLVFVFPKGSQVYWTVSGQVIAGTVRTGRVLNNWSGTFFNLGVDVVHNLSGNVSLGRMSVPIPAFNGIINLDTLGVKHLNNAPEIEAMLVERGAKYKKYSGISYVSYTGNVTRRTWYSEQNFRSDGRVMLDSSTFQRIDSDGHNGLSRSLNIEYNCDNKILLTEDLYFSTLPYLFGFSFRAKQWGMFNFDNISPIEWREDAYDKLVLDSEKKEMVKALVEHQTRTFSDIIDGKGGGCIFLMHGPAGQGKTLTAETVSELLQRPLYSVSIGELGTDPTQLETRLREILDIATVWGAVILLDEADIFLEARNEHDVLRNAMVGVFLRLLEYHQGVLFLTTNRVKNIDKAFYSRISVAIKFEDGTNDKREKIWRNLSEAAGLPLTENEIVRVANHNINGRQIKNIIRISQTMAYARSAPVTVDLIEKNIELTTEFERGFNN